MVGEEVRVVEREIDECIRKMSVWNTKRDFMLRRLVMLWRDAVELAQMLAAHAQMFGVEDGLQRSLAGEHLMVTGLYQTIKWTLEYGADKGNEEIADETLIPFVMKVAAPYQLLVDALKLGAHGMADFSLDHAEKTLTVYEGGEVSGHDFSIIERDHSTNPFHKQTPLIDDSDQLTKNWTAGQYREYWKWLNSRAEDAEKDTIMGQGGPLAPMVEIMKQPVVLDVPVPPASLGHVQQDLTLTSDKAKSSLKWKIDSWHDCPLVCVGNSVLGYPALFGRWQA